MSLWIRHFKIALYNLAIYIFPIKFSQHLQFAAFFTSAWLHKIVEIILSNGPKSEASETLNLKLSLINVTCHMYSVKGV